MSTLRSARISRGLTLQKVAQKLSLDPGGLSRIERGQQQPGTDIARRLFEFYGGEVPLSACYDPMFEQAKASGSRGRKRTTTARRVGVE